MGKLKRAILPGMLLVAAYYAVFGGEYSWFELRDARAAVEEERADLGELERQIDSVTLKRIARERFGMIRDHEILYLFAQPRDTTRLPTDTTSAASR